MPLFPIARLVAVGSLSFMVAAPIKDGGAEKSGEKWRKKIARMANSFAAKHPDKKRLRLKAFLGGGDARA